MLAAELVEQRKQIEAGVLVGGDEELSAVEFAEFGEGSGGLAAKVEQLQGVLAEDVAVGLDTGSGSGAVRPARIDAIATA